MKLYVIVMLCNDDEHCYIDYVNKTFKDLEQTKKCMLDCANDELNTLQDIGECKLVNLIENYNKIKIYNKFHELITEYSIIELDN